LTLKKSILIIQIHEPNRNYSFFSSLFALNLKNEPEFLQFSDSVFRAYRGAKPIEIVFQAWLIPFDLLFV